MGELLFISQKIDPEAPLSPLPNDETIPADTPATSQKSSKTFSILVAGAAVLGVFVLGGAFFLFQRQRRLVAPSQRSHHPDYPKVKERCPALPVIAHLELSTVDPSEEQVFQKIFTALEMVGEEASRTRLEKDFPATALLGSDDLCEFAMRCNKEPEQVWFMLRSPNDNPSESILVLRYACYLGYLLDRTSGVMESFPARHCISVYRLACDPEGGKKGTNEHNFENRDIPLLNFFIRIRIWEKANASIH